jgi:hypothetical protein
MEKFARCEKHWGRYYTAPGLWSVRLVSHIIRQATGGTITVANEPDDD